MTDEPQESQAVQALLAWEGAKFEPPGADFVRGHKPYRAYAMSDHRTNKIHVCFDDRQSGRRTWYVATADEALTLARQILDAAINLEN